MPLFDAYIFVDWSAVNGVQPQRPTADAVWCGELIPNLNFQQETYHQTRNDGASHVINALLAHIKEKRRVLVGFDFPYGYPSGFASALNLPSGTQAWWGIWAELVYRVEDTTNNKNNRFKAAEELNAIAGDGQTGPFWGCPTQYETNHLKLRSPGFPFMTAGGALQRLRIVETRLPGTQEAWGLYGPGRVGSQALVGIPYLYKLRRHLELVRFSRVWPFETLFTLTPSVAQGPFVLHAEIWPSVVDDRVRNIMTTTPDIIRDRAQVRAMCEWAAELDLQGSLGHLFAQPGGLNPQQVQACIEEEGWILGAE
jgi:molybdopterin-guanine dinucleotide biosynthesis protein B